VAILKTSVAQAAEMSKKKKCIFSHKATYGKISKTFRPKNICNVSIPAITAFVEATAGIILFTTPETQVR